MKMILNRNSASWINRAHTKKLAIIGAIATTLLMIGAQNPSSVAATITTDSIASPAAATRLKCSEMISSNLRMAGLQIVRSATVNGDPQAPSSYCVIQGRLNPRKGSDGKNYAIGFELRLPLAWNGRLVHQANGGNDGNVVPALGNPANAAGNDSPLIRGFAVLSIDAGHNGNDPVNASLGLINSNVFGLEPQARSDYGYSANNTIMPVAKSIVEKYYGQQPSYSYMVGCSNGGRHGLVAASRYPDLYDGIVSGDPGFNLPKAAVQHAWDVQSFQIADPDMRKAFSREDMTLVANKVTATCDALDGVEDGIVGNLNACQAKFNLADLQCKGAKNATCLSANQVKALSQSLAGPKNSKGEQLYSNWPYGAGLGGGNWRFWKIESTVPLWENYPLIATLGGGSLSYIFTTPPTQTPGKPADLVGFLSKFNFDTDAPKIFNKSGDYKESSMEFMTPPDAADPKLTEFQAKNRKLIVYHGDSDPVFSVNDTINWYEKLAKNNKGDASSFARLFVIPNMNHCSGGPATDQFDALSAIVNWVETGTPPDTLIATVNPTNPELPEKWSKTRTRPLCVWPKIAKYTGGEKGNLEVAASFTCDLP